MKTKPQETTEKKRCKVCNHFHEYNCWCECPAIPVEDFNTSLDQKPDQPEEDWEEEFDKSFYDPKNTTWEYLNRKCGTGYQNTVNRLIKDSIKELLAKQKEEIKKKLEGIFKDKRICKNCRGLLQSEYAI